MFYDFKIIYAFVIQPCLSEFLYICHANNVVKEKKGSKIEANSNCTGFLLPYLLNFQEALLNFIKWLLF